MFPSSQPKECTRQQDFLLIDILQISQENKGTGRKKCYFFVNIKAKKHWIILLISSLCDKLILGQVSGGMASAMRKQIIGPFYKHPASCDKAALWSLWLARGIYCKFSWVFFKIKQLCAVHKFITVWVKEEASHWFDLFSERRKGLRNEEQELVMGMATRFIILIFHLNDVWNTSYKGNINQVSRSLETAVASFCSLLCITLSYFQYTYFF